MAEDNNKIINESFSTVYTQTLAYYGNDGCCHATILNSNLIIYSIRNLGSAVILSESSIPEHKLTEANGLLQKVLTNCAYYMTVTAIQTIKKSKAITEANVVNFWDAKVFKYFGDTCSPMRLSFGCLV